MPPRKLLTFALTLFWCKLIHHSTVTCIIRCSNTQEAFLLSRNYSIDEFFMAYYGKDPDKVGEEIRRYVKKQFGITCSVGIAPGKS